MLRSCVFLGLPKFPTLQNHSELSLLLASRAFLLGSFSFFLKYAFYLRIFHSDGLLVVNPCSFCVWKCLLPHVHSVFEISLVHCLWCTSQFGCCLFNNKTFILFYILNRVFTGVTGDFNYTSPTVIVNTSAEIAFIWGSMTGRSTASKRVCSNGCWQKAPVPCWLVTRGLSFLPCEPLYRAAWCPHSLQVASLRVSWERAGGSRNTF